MRMPYAGSSVRRRPEPDWYLDLPSADSRTNRTQSQAAAPPPLVTWDAARKSRGHSRGVAPTLNVRIYTNEYQSNEPSTSDYNGKRRGRMASEGTGGLRQKLHEERERRIEEVRVGATTRGPPKRGASARRFYAPFCCKSSIESTINFITL
ncbi:hypothetical protein K432DRAFT_132672 [Lepidopterella palustris CBS 459.81]|uniref:Uncharacterized protein n=1 Tax=Lepidopterella palustris CBS 459.81 TaxID=1314670 RepID=A0A8E2E3X1_9PEZI|nr:hypothetical protein K432DRAFT_132672 [Lepidopterella palustris CBS 459.81]